MDKTSALSSNYAYLVAAGMKTGFDKVFEAKLFTKDGETKVFTSATKLKLNGTSGVLAEDVIDHLNGSGSEVIAQLVTFETNKDGELTQLNTAVDKTATGEINKNLFTLNAKDTLTYREASKKLGEFKVNKDTIVFDIPAGKTSPSDFSITNIEMFENENEYDVSIFDLGEDMTAKVVIVTNSEGSANLEAPIAVIDQISTVSNGDGETVQKVYLYINGERTSYVTEEDDVLVNGESKALVRGDIVQLKLNAKNEIENVRVLFEVANKATEKETKVSDDLITVYGKVVKKFSDSINVQVGDGKVKNYAISDAKVYSVDTKKTNKAIQVVTPGDIAQYDELDPSRVFLKVYKDVVQEIVIVK